MNLKTLAKLAGVSVGTVSKAFSGNEEISPETRERIFKLAKETGCFDKYNKNRFQKKVIAVISPELNSDFYNAFLSLLDEEISRQGGIMTVSVSNFSDDRVAELFSYYSSYCKADGILILCSPKKVKNPLLIPTVAIGAKQESCDHMDAIYLSLDGAITDAITHLKEHGHTQIGFIGETLTQAKQEKFIFAMQRENLPIRQEWIWSSDTRFEQAGTAAIEAWLTKGIPLPTAILTSYDYIAIGVIQALKKHGLRVPEDISVIGMDDIAVAPYLETSLSTIRTHTDEVCRTAVELIMKKLQNQHYSARRQITFYSEFISRDTSGDAAR